MTMTGAPGLVFLLSLENMTEYRVAAGPPDYELWLELVYRVAAGPPDYELWLELWTPDAIVDPFQILRRS